MKAAVPTIQPVEPFRPANSQALAELENFLRAVDSYPERFAREPEVSFEQHLNGLHARAREYASAPQREHS